MFKMYFNKQTGRVALMYENIRRLDARCPFECLDCLHS